MSNTYYLNTDELRGMQEKLNAGDRVILSGTIYTARDAAHKRIFGLLDEGKPLPFALEDAIIYYAGPTPAQQGMAVGACGPTTASRMNAFAPRLLDLGQAVMIGKGARNQAVNIVPVTYSHLVFPFKNASAIIKSSGVVILIFL